MAELPRALGDGGIVAHLQPIIDLDNGDIVAYEALARGRKGSPLEFPDRLFAAAREAGRLGELDAACMNAAMDAAAAARLERPAALFVNAEPETFDGPAPDLADPDCKVIVEITERCLTARPAELLVAVERARLRGWGIAVDDVGADWRSLALLPFLRPDVVKLDRDVLADAASPAAARVVRGARAHLERSGGLLLAEGIEDVEHERRARAFGARLGQGWHYGRPQRLERSQASRAQPGVRIVQARAPLGVDTPFGCLRKLGPPPAVATKGELLALSVDLEQEATGVRDPAVVLATFQDAGKFTATVRERYTRLARGAAFVAAFGVGLSEEPAPGVRGANLADGEALQNEWCVVVVTAHSTRALIARDLGDHGRDMERRFEYAITDDPDLVLRAGRALMLRIAADPPPRPAFRADLAALAPAARQVPHIIA